MERKNFYILLGALGVMLLIGFITMMSLASVDYYVQGNHLTNFQDQREAPKNTDIQHYQQVVDESNKAELQQVTQTGNYNTSAQLVALPDSMTVLAEQLNMIFGSRLFIFMMMLPIGIVIVRLFFGRSRW